MINVGIDLGTSNSVISTIDKNGEVKVLPNLDGKLTTPSIVMYDGNEITVGHKVKPKYKLGDSSTAGSFKVDIGSVKKFNLNGRDFSPIELSAEVLRYLKDSAEKATGEKIDKAVITVPAYFTELQRKQTREAGEMAGLNVARIINEPTSSALAYGVDLKEEQTILVYDLGGGTFDVSLLTVGDDTVEVIGTKGDNHLGGDDFDSQLSMVILRTLRKREKYKPSNEKAIRVVTEIARSAKEALSNIDSVELDLNIISKVDSTFKNEGGNIELTKEDFEAIISPTLERTIRIAEETVSEAGMSLKEVDKIILVGGSTKSPIVKTMLEKSLKRPVIQNDIDPDLIVSVGAAVQTSILTGDNKDMVLLDVTPLDLSVERVDGLTSKLIKANTSIPCRRSKVYTTSRDNQDTLEFNIYQGNNPIAKENEFLGQVTLSGILPAKAGEPQIDVVFTIDENGELEVKATDIMTFKSISIKREINV